VRRAYVFVATGVAAGLSFSAVGVGPTDDAAATAIVTAGAGFSTSVFRTIGFSVFVTLDSTIVFESFVVTSATIGAAISACITGAGGSGFGGGASKGGAVTSVVRSDSLTIDFAAGFAASSTMWT
jgi:hypothetical protein